MTPSTTDQLVPEFRPGRLVTVRGREWVVQPGSTSELLLLKPLSGADDEIVGIMPSLEPPKAARFEPPTLDDLGEDFQARLLRDAVRISVRDVPGPFRSFGRIAVEPRPYQLVPLMMALRLQGAADDDAYPAVRMMISDDVGIGKTIEAGLIAAELMVSGETDGISVVCPPHLADQWAQELRDKFHLEPTLVLPSTARRLERGLGPGESLFDRHKITVVSLDWIKATRRRDEYAQSAPKCVIVDEAHLCAQDPANSNRHLRHQLLSKLAGDPNRTLLLVTATPHSGKDGAFQSLIGLLHPRLAELPLAGDEDGRLFDMDADSRALLARHFIARKRIDVAKYAGTDTHFPSRIQLDDAVAEWNPSPDHRALIEDVLAWARGEIETAKARGARQERVRWWAVLALLRALASSPAAAASTLRNRAAGAAEGDDDLTVSDIEEYGQDTVLDPDAESDSGSVDADTGAVVEEGDRAHLTAFADRAEALAGPHKDTKLATAIGIAKDLLKDGHSPIFFCRFIHTAEYLAEQLSKALPNKVEIAAVTGKTPAEVRRQDVDALGAFDQRILVATDCLSEGINLQDHFNAVVHYDLPWNPTRLEQREGRVDRYGQTAAKVSFAALHGTDPTIDPLIRDVLHAKHDTIRKRLGFSLNVPGISRDLIEAAAERLLSDRDATPQSLLEDLDYQNERDQLASRWEDAADREERWRAAAPETESRAKFAQRSITPEHVDEQFQSVRELLGDAATLGRFVADAVQALGGTASGDAVTPGTSLRLGLAGVQDRSPQAAAELALVLGGTSLPEQLNVRFAHPAPPKGLLLSRTHPFVTALARHLTDLALDRYATEAPARRVGVITTSAVQKRTVLATCRFRHDLRTKRRTKNDDGSWNEFDHSTVVDDITTIALPLAADITVADLEELLAARPTANTPTTDARDSLEDVLARLSPDKPDADYWEDLRAVSKQRAGLLEEAHRSVRQDLGGGFGTVATEPHEPDLLALHILERDHSAGDR